MMFISIIMIIFNIIIYSLLNQKYNNTNDYIKEKEKYNKLKLLYLDRYINISYIVINIIHYIITTTIAGFNSIDLLPIYLILFTINILMYLYIEFNNKNKYKYKFKYIDKKLIDSNSFLLIIISFITFIIEKKSYKYTVGEYEKITNYNIIISIVAVFLLLIPIFYLIKYIISNRRYFSYGNNIDDYLEDIKYYKKIDIKDFFNYVIYITAYIAFFYVNFPFIYILYIIIALLLIYVISKKIKKIRNESDRLYKSVTLANKKPGLAYAFFFTKDFLLLKKLIIFFVMFVTTTLSYYLVGEIEFSIISISIYILLIYNTIEDKIYLNRYVMSLNDDLIDKKEYKINEIKKINYIDKICIFKIDLYKLIICDTINYESNYILYDPEYRIDEVEIRIKKDNIEDYIIINTELYEE